MYPVSSYPNNLIKIFLNYGLKHFIPFTSE